MNKCGRYRECESCLNRLYDQFQCEDCEDGSNYEPIEDDLDEDNSVDEMTYEEFRQWITEAAA